MKAYVFLSVHEELFHRVAEHLRAYGIDRFSGFAWGVQQVNRISNRGIDYDPMVVFSRDLLPEIDDGAAPDVAWLERRERELGVSITRMLTAERHLLAGRTFTQLQRMAEVALRKIAAALDDAKPDFIFSEDVSCFHSYVHFVLAKERGIPFWAISSGRLPNTLSVYSSGFQTLDRANHNYAQLMERGLTPRQREEAQRYVDSFRTRPARPSGMEKRDTVPRVQLADLGRLKIAMQHYFGDRGDPTGVSPLRAIRQRLQRIARVKLADATHVFEAPVAGEKYVLYPIHFQPEASTLVQSPMYLDQVVLLEDIAKSLPIGHRLYVKEHVSNRGRRPIAFYEAIRRIPAVRLLSPNEDVWSLIRNASAIAVITGTMGWEGLLFGKPVITFGEVFYNQVHHVYRAFEAPKDRWYQVFRRALFAHEPDENALLAFVAALQQAALPGSIHNPTVFPHVLEEENVENIARALAAAAHGRALS